LEHPLIIADPLGNTRDRREKICALAFEQHRAPALFLASTAVLNAFAMGKTSALILDVGAGVTSAVPVFEGFKLLKGMPPYIYIYI
jgi:actin-related protein